MVLYATVNVDMLDRTIITVSNDHDDDDDKGKEKEEREGRGWVGGRDEKEDDVIRWRSCLMSQCTAT